MCLKTKDLSINWIKDKEYRQSEEVSSRVQSAFMSNNNIELHLKLLHGIRICGSFFTGLTFFCV